MLAERLRLEESGGRKPPSTLGPHVMPGRIVAPVDSACDECEWLFRRKFGLLSCACSASCSKIVLEGDPGLGGVPDRDVAELRDERVKVFSGADFSGVEVVEALEESFDSTRIRALLFADFVRFSMLPTLESSLGRSDDPVEGDGGVPPLNLSLILRSNGIGFSGRTASGADRGIAETIDVKIGVLSGRVRTGDSGAGAP